MSKQTENTTTNIDSKLFENLDDMISVLITYWFTVSHEGVMGIPVILKGPPGGGKTTIVKQASLRCGLSCIPVLPALREPSEIAMGLPAIFKRVAAAVSSVTGGKKKPEQEVIPGSDGEPEVRFIAPMWAKVAARLKYCNVFFDEGNAAQSLQKAMLRVSLERVAGEVVLPSQVRVTLAMNSVEDAADGHDLAPALANRHAHVPFRDPTAGELADFLVSHPVRYIEERSGEDVLIVSPAEAIALEKKILSTWDANYAWAAGVVSAFLRRRPVLVRQQPSASDPKSSEAWASPRTWHDVACILAGARCHGLSQALTQAAVICMIGKPGSELFSWLRLSDIPDAGVVLDGQERWSHDPTRPDRSLAFYQQIVALLSDHKTPNREKRFAASWTLLKDNLKNGKDLVFPTMKGLIGTRISIRGLADAEEVLSQLQSTAKIESTFNGRQ